MLPALALPGAWVESQASASRVLQPEAESASPDEETRHHARPTAAGGAADGEPGLGAGFHAWHVTRRSQVSLVECDRGGQSPEVLDAWLFDSLAQAQQILKRWHIEYTTLRSHESLGKKAPLAYLPGVVNSENSTFNLST